MKKLLLLTLIVTMTLSLAACGKNTTNEIDLADTLLNSQWISNGVSIGMLQMFEFYDDGTYVTATQGSNEPIGKYKLEGDLLYLYGPWDEGDVLRYSAELDQWISTKKRVRVSRDYVDNTGALKYDTEPRTLSRIPEDNQYQWNYKRQEPVEKNETNGSIDDVISIATKVLKNKVGNEWEVFVSETPIAYETDDAYVINFDLEDRSYEMYSVAQVAIDKRNCSVLFINVGPQVGPELEAFLKKNNKIKQANTKKNHIGNWYVGLCYNEDGGERKGREGEKYDIEIWLNVYENGTYKVRFLEPADPEDVTEVFKYEVVNSPSEIQKRDGQLYYDSKNDQLMVSIDGTITIMDRMK